MTKTSSHQWLASGMFVGAILAFGILMTTPKSQADLLVYSGLITGLGLVIISFLAFLLIELKKLWYHSKSTPSIINNSLRQAFELAIILILVSLYLLGNLNLWEAVLLIIAIISFEIIISLKKTF